MLRSIIHDGEEGHGMPLLGTLAGGVGAILLAIGAANGTGVLAVVGGIVLAVALSATVVLDHIGIDYDVYRRLDDLEKK
ncbi:MAG: hypothetical protein ACYDCT_10475 [Dehalococcoidia bacterium]